MIARIRQLYHRHRLARIVEANRKSFGVQDYRKRRQAMLSYTRRTT